MKIDAHAFDAASTPAGALTPEAALAAADAAVRRVAPVWPLGRFVAVNPWLGFSERPFEEAAAATARLAGARAAMPRAFYAEALATGRLTLDDLAVALAEAQAAGKPGLPATAEALAEALKTGAEPPRPAPIETFAEHLAQATGTDWAALTVERIAAWAASRFDEGQAAWPSPFRDLPPYAAWQAEAAIDRTPDTLGLPGYRAAVAQAPDTPAEALAWALARLGVAPEAAETFLARLLFAVGGWAAHARRLLWEAELHGGTDPNAHAFAAIRAVHEAALLAAAPAAVAASWGPKAAALPADPAAGTDPAAHALDAVLLAAFEHGWRKGVFARIGARPAPAAPARPAVQATFCIDVRSEIIRRAIESETPDVATMGFAGFFGFAIEYVPVGRDRGGAQCPVLLTPTVTVRESVKDADREEETEILGLRLMRLRAGKAWKSFKLAAVSSFGFVEALGLGYAGKLATDGLGLTRPVAHPHEEGLDDDAAARLVPTIETNEAEGRLMGIPPATRLAMAEGVLKAMSMTKGFARLVMLTGHGSTTVNNPHATGLDCGACGGHTGEANARVAAAVMNDPGVREGLKAKGIAIPEDTVFLAAQHDTTTDEIEIFDLASVPPTHAEDLATLRKTLKRAARRARAERSGLLNIAPGAYTDAAVLERSRDWSQVRPEWGLAGCAAFIAAPRSRTEGMDLGGRSFLHSYDWQDDAGFGVLELIMTAPMVVASWINLQYYGSSVEPRVFGCGDKTLHNVVGGVGVLEGNGGDLRVGLPWQSVHDGVRLVHEPMRLAVLIEAPVEAMTAIIERHPGVRDLLDNGWLHLFALDENGRVANRYLGDLRWQATLPPSSLAA